MDWRNGSLYFLWLVLGLASINGYAEKKVVCYYTNWSIYRPGTAKFSPENINPYLCTHLIYAFGGFTKDNTLKPFDKYQDIEKGGYAKFNGLKTYNKKLKTMLAIGGWNEGSTRFSPMVADPERRRALVKNAVKFLRQNHFDGLDLDWEYPAFRDGGKPRDKNNYADLVQELRQEFERESSKTGRPRLLLSMAIPAGIEYLEKGYDLARLNEYLDFFNLLSYDYHSAFEPAVNHHSPLYGLEEDNEYNYDNELTVDFTMSYLLKHHVSPDKLILGIPTYGRSYTLYNQDATAIGSPADGPGEEGDATREKGYLAYYEICANVKSSQWEVVQPNPKAMGPYAFKGNQWVGYDDEDIVKMKSLYVVEKNLGGIMFWAIDNDDFRGNCHGRPYPLIEAAKEALLGAIENEQTTQKPKSGLRKKTRPQLSSQRSNDSNNRRARPEKQRPTTTQSPRKRVSQRTESNARNRGSSEENEDRKVEDEGNAVRETSGQWKSNQRNRSSKGTNRRKVQTTERYEEPIEEEARESTSGRLTTPEPPTTPDPGSDFKCEDEGFFSHPRDCKKYFWCLDSGPGGLGIVAHQFTCPSGLVFNKAADSCDYPRNVVCPKAKTKAATTTPKAPVTTTSRPTTTTRRTTTTEETSISAEEYEYEEDENATDEEIIEEIKSTTSRPLIYKTISRNKPTTMTTEATEAPTTNPPRIFKPNSAKVFDLEDEEDPRVIKELIELIKKAGGLEQLERQLNIQEKSPMRKSDTGDDGPVVTPATISRSLYERVLSRQANKVNHLFGPTTQRTTTEESKKTKSETQNGPGGAQFEGLDDVPEVKSLRRTKKPQYVTIERQRPSTTPVFEDEFDDEELADESSEEDNADVASSEEQTVSDLPESRKDSAKKVTPNYVNILRSRPTTSAYENDLDVRDEAKEKEAKFSQENSDKTENESFSRQRPVISSSNDDIEKETVVPKNRYTNTQRFRSTTLRTDESTAFTESIKPSEKTTTEIVNPTTPAINQERKELISETLAFSTLPVSTIEFSSTPVAETSKQPSTATEVISGSKATISTTHLPLAESTIEEVENLVTEIPMTTQPTTRATQASRTTAVSQPRPFGFPRRGRPTTTTASPTVASTTDQSRVKISPAQDLPTLKNLINHELLSQSVDHVYDDFDEEIVNSGSYETDSDHFQGIPVSVRILSDENSQELADQLAVLHLPQSILNSLVSHSNILRIQVVNQPQEDDNNDINKDNLTTTTSFTDSTLTTETPTTIQENPSSVRGFFITKSLNTSQSTTPTPTSDSSEPSTIQPSTQSTDLPESTTDSSNLSTQSTVSFALSLSTSSTSDSSETTSEIEVNSSTISPVDATREIVSTTVTINEVTTLPPTTEYTTVSSETERALKSIKQITVLRRRLDESIADPSRQDRQFDSQESKITAPDASQNNWRKRVIRKRPRSLLVEDQSLSESQFQDTVVTGKSVVPPTNTDDKLNKTGKLLTVGEVNPMRTSTNFLRKPGTRLEVQNRLKNSRNKTQDGTNSERRYSSKVKSDYDQSGRAQELEVLVADPPTETSSPRLGNEKIASRLRDVRDSVDEDATEPSIFTTARTTTPTRRRQKPKSERPVKTTTQRPRHPAIIDYDYYVDEEVRLSLGPELRDKIYVTDRGTIGCLDQGTFAHPTSCKKFITCAKMVGGQVSATEYTCPKKLSFDPVGGICNWSAGLGCNEST